MKKPPPKQPLKQLGRYPRANQLDEDDQALWRAVTKDVTPLEKQSPSLKPNNVQTKSENQNAPKPSAQTIKTTIIVPQIELKPNLPVPTNRHHKSSYQTDKRTHQKFKDGRMEFDGTIDLHGLTVAEAHQAFLNFVRLHIRAGSRMLLVITGKGRGGIHSDHGGIGAIRAALPSWVHEHDIDHSILKVSAAQTKHGGAGAFYILLRRSR